MGETQTVTKSKSKKTFRSLRLSLKYRPDVLKLVLKMRHSIRRKKLTVKTLTNRLKEVESLVKELESIQSSENTKSKKFQDSSTQTSDKDRDNLDPVKEDVGWNLKENGESEKSIAEQVKEAAQSVLQDRGMVYVESAGMYYDYKTGYYYNSELGLYYHTDTGCYYHYSDNQFVFHSYPDMSKVNSALLAHQKKKERKLKRERKPEEDIENLTKHLSQDKEEDQTKPKKPRKNKEERKKKEKKIRKDKKENAESNHAKDGKKDEKIVSDETNSENKDKDQDGAKNDSTEAMNVDKEQDNETKTEEKSAEKKIESEENSEKAGDVMEVDSEIPKEEGETKKETSEIQKEKSEIQKEISEIQQETSEIEEHASETQKETSEIEKEKSEIEELEDGECSESGSDGEVSESEAESESSKASTATVSDEDSIAKQHPPCMRVIVRETKLPKLKVGSLFLITKDGGTVGREGEQHAILLRDQNVSRTHLDIKYDMAKKTYVATDLGSKNGSILNGNRMSESQEISLPLVVLHGSTIQLGETKLLCHIHPGNSTCGQCEPGLLMQVEEEKKVAYTRTVSVKKQHELELARLKNIYAPQHLAIEEKPYNDRAQARREAVGSMNHAEKTQSVDLNTSIAADNKGFKLLQKMGWSEGEGLGKDSQGHTEPVPLVSNEGKSGLGNEGAVAPPTNKPKPRVNQLASGAMRLASRTKMLQPPAKAFQTNFDDEDESE